MLVYPLYLIKYIFWLVGRLKRRLGRGPENLVLILRGDYAQIPGPPQNFIVSFFRPPQISLLQLGEQFRQAANDPGVKTVILHIRPLEMASSKLDVLRGYIRELQMAGKRVVAWSYQYNIDSYYLACAADEILLLPGGNIEPLGIAREYIYLGEALAQIGVKPDFVQISPYKSAGDIFSRRGMSDEVRQMGNWLAEATWKELIDAIGKGRGLEQKDVMTILDQTPCTDLDAKGLGLVDELLNEDDLPTYLGSKENPTKLSDWDSALGQLQRKPPRKPGKYIALMGIEGIIVDGDSQQPPMTPPLPLPFGLETRAGDLSVTKAARKILTDKSAEALVVYVNSRGGSASASESMSAALRKVAEKKPVFVVMGPVAASGGYYVSTPGQKIFAQPTTITGSIGVIYGKFAVGELLERLFIKRELINRGEAALFNDPEKPWSEAQRAKVWDQINRVYDLFLERAADSRGLSVGAVDEVGGGRVWTGRQALDQGLIDELGGLDQAIEEARGLVKLPEDAGIRLYFPEKGNLPPITEPASVVSYVIENYKMLDGRVMCLLPWLEKQR